MSRPPSNEFFIKKAWNWTDTRDLWEDSGKDFETFLDAAHSAGVLKKPSYDNFDEFQNAYKTDNDSTFDRRWTSGWYNPLSYGKAENAALVGKMNKEIYTAGKKYYDDQAKQRNRQTAVAPEQVSNTPGSFTTSTGATVTPTSATQATTGGEQPQAGQANAPFDITNMDAKQRMDFHARHAARYIDSIARNEGVSVDEARRRYYQRIGDPDYVAGNTQPQQGQQPQQPQTQQPQAGQQQGPRGYQGGTVTVNGNTYPANDPVTGAPFVTEAYGVPRYANNKPNQPAQQGQQQPSQQPQQPQTQVQQPQQPQAQQPKQPQQPQAQQPQQPVAQQQVPAIKKAASLAKSFAAGRFSSDEVGDNKAAANRAVLWNKFNGD